MRYGEYLQMKLADTVLVNLLTIDLAEAFTLLGGDFRSMRN